MVTDIDPSFFKLTQEQQLNTLGGATRAGGYAGKPFLYQGQPYTLVQPESIPAVKPTTPVNQVPASPKPSPTPSITSGVTVTQDPVITPTLATYSSGGQKAPQADPAVWWMIPAVIGGLGLFDWVTGWGDDIAGGIGEGIGDIFGGLFGGLTGMNDFNNMFEEDMFNFNMEGNDMFNFNMEGGGMFNFDNIMQSFEWNMLSRDDQFNKIDNFFEEGNMPNISVPMPMI